jgi:nitronate monooxygenase
MPVANTGSVLDRISVPIVQAPLAGGASTPELSAAVAGAGGLGFVAAGYKTADAVRSDIEALRALTDAPFGVNVFVPGGSADPEEPERYAQRLRDQGLEPGEPRWEDDFWEAKLELLLGRPPAVVSFTFGCPRPDTIGALREAGVEVWLTVTSPQEAAIAIEAGAAGLVAQGTEAGGHRGAFGPDTAGELGLLALLALLGGPDSAVPLVASGGIATAPTVAAVLAAGARAAQVGTAFMRCPEAGTAAPHRDALGRPGATRVTRAFTGKPARGIVNRFLAEHDEEAPEAYPELHHLTAPIRAAARERGDPDDLNLWAGQAHELAPELPAAEVVRQLASRVPRLS